MQTKLVAALARCITYALRVEYVSNTHSNSVIGKYLDGEKLSGKKLTKKGPVRRKNDNL